MLVLTRRVGEVIVIGDNIRLVVVRIRGHQVQLGIAAPRDVPVYREEIQKKNDARAAATALPIPASASRQDPER